MKYGSGKEGDVQVRLDNSQLVYFDNVLDAIKFALNNNGWKVSFTYKDERVRLVRNDDGEFVYESIEEMLNNSEPTYLFRK